MNRKKQPEEVREQPLTYDDYAAMTDEGARYELVDGALEAMTPGPTPKHQLVIQAIENKLQQTCKNDYIILESPVDVILSKTEVRQPDLVLVHRDRLSIVTKRGIEGPPDLVIEVVSPSSIKRDRGSKLETYSHYAIPEYWIVDVHNEAIEQYILEEAVYKLHEVYINDEAVSSARIPCASFSMDDILRDVPELPNA